MNATDSEHLKKAIEQFRLFLMNGLVVIQDSSRYPPTFVTSMSGVLSKGMQELWKLSSETKDRMSYISWDFVERMCDPLEVEKEFAMNPLRISGHLKEEIPMFLDKTNALLNEEE